MHATVIDPLLSVSQIVKNDYRTADVFKQWGINYCCGGNHTLSEACAIKGLNEATVTETLQSATTPITLPSTIQFGTWKLDFLIDYISNIHHAYLQHTLPLLEMNLTTFIEGHKKKFPELQEVLLIFKQLAAIALAHNEQEEKVIFPYLKQIINTYRRKETYGSLFVKTLRKPLNDVIEKEHQQIANPMLQLREATNHYAIPANACTNYGVHLHKLKELDNDLVQHKHLENNILFPKIMAMEQELLQC